jgi:hypothetical protein
MFVCLKNQFLFFDICTVSEPRNKAEGEGADSNHVIVIKLVPDTWSVPDNLPVSQGDTFHEKRDIALVK